MGSEERARADVPLKQASQGKRYRSGFIAAGILSGRLLNEGHGIRPIDGDSI
jgi:hypothetical protein